MRRVIQWSVLLVVAAILAFWPLPYYIYGPWAADDLNRIVHVKGHQPPPGILLDTSILILPGRPATYIAAKTLPGFEMVPRTDLAPPSMSDLDVLRYMFASQEEGKRAAEIVAARAAGLTVPVHKSFYIARLSPDRRANQCFKRGDELVRVDGASIDTSTTLVEAAERRPMGSTFALDVVRGASRQTLRCTTAPIKGKKRFGIIIGEFDEVGKLPIDVSYTLPLYQAGGSTGLMFALQIYRMLTGVDLTHGAKVAGTGVISASGQVQPIAGARQKVIAAKRAGATIFLVPQQNYADIRNVTGIRVIPVGSFNEAVNWLTWRLQSCPHAADDITAFTGIKFADLPIGDAEKNGTRLPAGILRLDYGHQACNLVRFWYFWQDHGIPLRVHFARAAIRSATLADARGSVRLTIVDRAGNTYVRPLAAPPDALVVYYVSSRPGLALWMPTTQLQFIGFRDRGLVLWSAQPH